MTSWCVLKLQNWRDRETERLPRKSTLMFARFKIEDNTAVSLC